MPLTMATVGDVFRIKRVGGLEDTRRHLANMGFVEDAEITVISETAGNLIVLVKGTRVALGKELANKITVG